MKKLWTACLLALAVGCQSAFERDAHYGTHAVDRETKTEKPKIEKRIFQTSLRLAPETAGADLEAMFSCDMEWPSDKTLAQFADATLVEAYQRARGEERTDVVASGVQGVKEAFFDDYREWFAEDWDGVEKGELDKHVACWSCHVKGRVERCDKTYFSYRVTIGTYCGGAHGYRWIQNATYSRRDGRRLTVADVIKKKSMTAVVNLIRKAVRAQARADQHLCEQLKEEIRQPYDEYVRDVLGRKREEMGNPLVTENFMLVTDGIVWTYNQYEIACYASGWFDARVPWQSLGPHLRSRTVEAGR